MIVEQLLWGAVWALGNVIFHIVGLVHLGRLLVYLMPSRSMPGDAWHRVLFLSVAVLVLVALHLVEAAGWALLYCWVGEFDDYPQALYFSVVTATTLGYGDMTLSESWRLLGVFEAMVGLLLFGASTAAVFQLLTQTLPNPFEGLSQESGGK